MKLPPLNAVRAFEVAARLRSIKDAAGELNVTPGAVSRQVKILEEFLDMQLFKRGHREIVLTPTGEQYQTSLTKSLASIEEATNDILGSDNDRPLHVWCSITFSLRWLMPRLQRFHADNDQGKVSDVSFTTSLHPHDLLADKIDIAIRAFGITGRELTIETLFETDIVPVCSPDYHERYLQDRETDFRRCTLLHSKIRSDDWSNWFKQHGRDMTSEAKNIYYGSSTLAYEAATLGRGIALAMRAFVENELKSGVLIQPFEEIIEKGATFYMTFHSDRRKRHRIAEFREWILAEARQN
ncbi:MAG: LysR substrate-binding domain-containing protein [Pseudomonadota bacterium]|nr:LysR substrate-binding domain-containing protein [Pseudomonadota bacterium]